MSAFVEILEYAAFTLDPASGNPAGVVLDASGLSDAEMLGIAGKVGHSETAFLFPRDRRADGAIPIRYFSREDEVAFCGHATIATGVAWAERHGATTLSLATNAGDVPVLLAADGQSITATLTSVEPRFEPLASNVLAQLLGVLGYSEADLDTTCAPAVAFAGLWHPVVPLASREALAALAYEFDALLSLMRSQGWTTVAAMWRESERMLHVRNPFPVGGVVEDPATGSAAAAVGGYLRQIGAIEPPTTLEVRQGEDMGRPSLIRVGVDLTGGIRVGGTAVRMD